MGGVLHWEDIFGEEYRAERSPTLGSACGSASEARTSASVAREGAVGEEYHDPHDQGAPHVQDAHQEPDGPQDQHDSDGGDQGGEQGGASSSEEDDPDEVFGGEQKISRCC